MVIYDYSYVTMVCFMDKFQNEVSAGEFKAKCLKLMDEVRERHKELIITKHGKRVAKLVPVEEKAPELFGFLQGSMNIKGDIMAPINEDWEAEQ